jgi:hypothetical protein
MGMHKHGVSGRSPKSPRLRLALRRAAEKDERKRRDSSMYDSVGEAVKKQRKSP